MLKSSSPPRFNIAFGSSAGGGFIRPIPQDSQIGVQGGAASLTDGFVPLNFQPVAAGGIPPFGEDFNGLLNQITLWNQWQEAGGPIYYDATFAGGGSGGYPNGAIVQSNVVPGDFWMSTADNNTTDPDSVSAANWVPDPGRIASGTPVPSFSSTVPTGFVPANALTIGNALSNGTGRANADTLLLYRNIWNTFSNAVCPIFTSTGSASTRGANPDADFAANKALATPDMKGAGLIGVDTMGGSATTRLSGVPVASGSTTAPGSVIGADTQLITQGNLPVTTPTGSVSSTLNTNLNGVNVVITAGGANSPNGGPNVSISSFVTVSQSVTSTFTGNAFGSGVAINNVQRSTTVFWNLKL